MTIDEAKWKKIDGYPNYSISNRGEVRNDATGKQRCLQHDKYGYLTCTLYNGHCARNMKVHRLVAYAFIPNPENKPYVNHINGVKNDNTVNNLEWCTAKENNDHAWKVLDSSHRRKTMAEHSHNRKWTEESRNKMKDIAKKRVYTEEYRRHMSEAHKGKEGNHKTSVLCVETGIVFHSIKQASEKMGILRTSICNVLSGLSENAKGYHFRKVE